MVYDTSSLRRLGEDHTPNLNLRSNGSATIICLKASGEILWARTEGTKDDLIDNVDWNNDVVIWPWVGQWHTDLFLVTKKDVDIYYGKHPKDTPLSEDLDNYVKIGFRVPKRDELYITSTNKVKKCVDPPLSSQSLKRNIVAIKGENK